MKKVLITGITGQDGSYIAELLINKGYEVFGMVRRSSSFNRSRIEHLYIDKCNNEGANNTNFKLLYGDLTDSSNLNRILEKVQPDEIYNLGAQSHVGISFQVPEYSAQVDGIGVLRILDAIKEVGIKTKFYQASTSELYGKAQEIPQTEKTPFYPRSPYATAKLFAYWAVVNYREAYNIFACNGILFNHESPRRGENFVTRKITLSACRIKAGIQNKLLLGNLYSKRDWGYAPEYVDAMWRMLQLEKPEDFVISTGKSYSIKEFVEKVFNYIGIEIYWTGKGINEKGIDKKKNKVLIEIDPKYFRPSEVDHLVGDSSKAQNILQWEPKVNIDELIRIMVDNDMKLVIKQES